DTMARLQQEIAKIVAAEPNVEAYMSRAGGTGGQGGNGGWVQVRLKPRAERNMSADQIIERLRPKVNAVAGVRAYPQNPPLVRIGGYQSRSQYQFTLLSQNLPDLYRSAGEMERRMREIPAPEGRGQLLQDVSSDLLIASP